jgi:preprotein translocase subunit SecA
MFKKFVNILGGDPNRREVARLADRAEQINRLEAEFETLSDDALRAKTDEFRTYIKGATEGLVDQEERRQAEKDALNEILPQAFAAVREASKRTIGLRHYEVQMIGGIVLHEGKIAEMRTGEGKTLVATLPLYLNALTGRGVHLITVNDYLARRDARWMAPIYNLLGLSVGVLQMASRTENGRKAFLVDLEKSSPFEDQHQIRLVDRVEAYRADITYGTNSEFGFDYLRDNLTNRLEDRSQRGHFFAIVDEVDNILIDEARTPLIISGPAADDAEWYVKMAQVVRVLNVEDYEINERDRTVTMTEVGAAHVEEILDMPLGDPERPEDINPEQARVLGFLEQALKAQFLFRRNKDYLVQGGKVVIVDEFTGRLMPGRRWSEGLHQAVEAKEGVRVEAENVTYATITIQNYFRMYEKLAGMTGTAETEAEEFHKIYKLDVLPIPTNLEYQVIAPNAGLIEVSEKDEEGYKYNFYTNKTDPLKMPVFWRRKDYPDVIYRTEEAKIRAIVHEIVRYYVLGRPQLVGTTSVEHSDRLSQRLQPELLRRLMQATLIRSAWLKHHNRQETEVAIPELQWLYKPLNELNTGEMRQFARPVGMTSINPEDQQNIQNLLTLLYLSEEDIPRLTRVLQGGVPHQVLNARKHDEESLIIARAGAFGAVTIATNMAGRGVDIKLGGEMNEEIIKDIIRVIGRRKGLDPYNMTNEQRRQVLREMTDDQFGIYLDSVKEFIQYMDEMDRVRELGGLHVIGSERHEARRIDNQLRGRSSRQGDPGSSRFYLSLEDELMRLFGGQQVENMLARLNIDESLPIENNLVARLVEQSQTRVEGANFDIRKHLLEYDDVLNMQRKRIYEQRDRVFTKEDLSADVDEMLHKELQNRIPTAFNDDEGPWKLIAYLDEIQPPINVEGVAYPSYSYRLLIETLKEALGDKPVSANELRSALLDLARQALEAERAHILRGTEALLDQTEESINQQREERIEIIDTFFQGLSDRIEEAGGQIRPQELLDELSSLVRIQLRLPGDQLRALAEGDEESVDLLREQVEASLLDVAMTRLLATVQRRVEEFDMRATQLQNLEWDEAARMVYAAVDKTLQERIERLAAPQGQIDRDLETSFEKLDGGLIHLNQNISAVMGLLMLMMQGSRLTFDRRTHRRGRQRVIRLSYVFLAARLLEGREMDELTEEIIQHLEGARKALQVVWGNYEYARLFQSETTLERLDERLQERLRNSLGDERFEEIASLSLNQLQPEEISRIILSLGQRLQNEIYREVLLGVISQLWVDYLTRVDALRVSIGLEAYGQRDPLVQYKGRASEMFTTLLGDIRSGVVARMFTFSPSRSSTVSIGRERVPETLSAENGQGEAVGEVKDNRSMRKKKRRRH